MPPETAVSRDSPPDDGGGGTAAPWGPPMSAGAGIVTNWGRRDSSSSSASAAENGTLGRRQIGERGAADAVYFAEAARGYYPPGAAVFSRAPEPHHGVSTVGVPYAPPAAPRGYHDLAIAPNRNSIINTGHNRATPSPAAARPRSTEAALALRASLGSHRRHALQAGAGETHDSSRAPHDQSRAAGWRRISSGHRREGGDDAAEGGSEVWEWNGRRVVIHASPPTERVAAATRSEGEAETAGGRKEGKRISALHGGW